MWNRLVELGLEEKEAKLYVAVLTRDRPTMAEVAEAIGVSRTNAYDVAKRLVRRGLLSVTEIDRPGSRARVELRAADPQVLEQQWDQRKHLLDDLVPQLRAAHRKAGSAPRARYLEGGAGIRTAMLQTLEWPSPLRAILSMRDLLLVPGKDEMDAYIAQRIQRGLQLRVIRSREHEANEGWFTSAAEFRQARFAPDDYVFTMSMLIGPRSVVLVASSDENFALVIDSAEFAELHSHLFEVLWQVSAAAPGPDLRTEAHTTSSPESPVAEPDRTEG